MNIENEYERAAKLFTPEQKKSLDEAVTIFHSVIKSRDSARRMLITKGIFDRLARSKPLTPIVESDFPEFTEDSNVVACPRYESLVKKYDKDTKTVTYSDLRRVKFNDQSKLSDTSDCKDTLTVIFNRSRRPAVVDKIVDDLFPIELPYMPDNVYNVFGTLVCFKEDGDSRHPDLVEVSFVETPSGQLVKVDRHMMKTADGTYQDIDERLFYHYRSIGGTDLNFKWLQMLPEVSTDNERRIIEFVLAKNIREIKGEMFGTVIARLTFEEPNTLTGYGIRSLKDCAIDFNVEKQRASENLRFFSVDKIVTYDSVEEMVKSNPIQVKLKYSMPKELVLGFVQVINTYCDNKTESGK